MGRAYIETAVSKIKKEIETCEQHKKRILNYLYTLQQKYLKKEISRKEYLKLAHTKSKGKNLQEWFSYYNSHIKKSKKEIKKLERKTLKTTLTIISLTLIIFSLIYLPIFTETNLSNITENIYTTITGFAIDNQTIQDTNQSLSQESSEAPKNLSPSQEPPSQEISNISELNITKKTQTNISQETNQTQEIAEVPKNLSPSQEPPSQEISNIITTEKDITITTTQQQAKVGEPVKWEKHIQLKEAKTTKIQLPKNSENIIVNKVAEKKQAKFSLTGKTISDIEEEFFLIKIIKRIFGAITGRAVEKIEEVTEVTIEDTALEYKIEYETPAPQKFEEKVSKRKKKITISGPDEPHYENVLAFTQLPEEVEERKIKLYRTTEGIKETTQFNSYDNNNNGLTDYIEWIVPHLSNQTYELEIIIIDAEHLNPGRNFIANIYEEVNKTDGITYTIPKNHYARAYFETNLTNQNVIDIYILDNGPATIEVYEKNSSVIVGEIDIEGEGIYIIDLNHSGSQSIFDLKSVNKEIVYDYIHDGKTGPNTFTAGPTDDGPVDQGNDITFTATGTSSQGYSYVLTICDDITTVLDCNKNGPVGTCTGGTKLCGSSSTVSSGTQNSCVHSTGGESGTVNYNAYTCNSNGNTAIASSNPNSYQINALPNTAPTLSGLPDVNDDEDFGTNNAVMDLWDYASDAEDADDALTYAIDSESDTSAVDCSIFNSHFISCTSQSNASGFNDVTVSATDTGALADTDIFRFTVNTVNDNPWNDGLANPSNVNEDTGLNENVILVGTLNTAFRDVEEDQTPTTYAIQSQTGSSIINCVLDGSNNIDCTTQNNQSGSNTVTVRISDSGTLYTEPTFTITVDPINDQPWSDAIANPSNINEDSGINDNIVSLATINTAFRDIEENQDLTSCTISSESDTTAVDCSVDGSYNVDCTTQNNQSGSNTVTLNCCDSGTSCTNMDPFTITVDAVNDNPWNNGLSNPSNVNEDSGLNENVISVTTLNTAFRDVEENQNPTTYTIQSQTGSSIINCVLDGSNNIDCTTQSNQSGSNTVTVRISDSGTLYTEPTFTITVDAVNDAPWVDGLTNPTNLTYNSGLNQDIISSTNINNNFRDVENDQSPTSVIIVSESATSIVDCDIDGSNNLDCTTQTDQFGTSTVVLNYTDSGGLSVTDTIDISVTFQANQPPQITQIFNETMTDVSTGPDEAPSITQVTINFTAYDENGYTDLNDSTARINFTKSGEDTRQNLSCSRIASESSGNYANYSCLIEMQYWDASGTWDITAYIEDNEQEAIQNTSSFYLGATFGFVSSPSIMSWTGGIAPGSINQEATSNPITLNNTGNVQRSIEINATNLLGETDNSLGLWAGNFTVKNTAGCDGTAMSSSVFTTVFEATLPRGNVSIEDGTGQEELYMCLEIAGAELISQPYSTGQEGSWTIRIFTIALTLRRKRKKKQQKQLNIPLSIFSEKLGFLEAITKYLKENLEMNYSEIGELLNRDQRTIWTAYNKANKKYKAKLKTNKIEIFIPSSIFENKELTIFESIVTYLKSQNMKYIEIAELLNRNQKNIWTVYSRAAKKVTKKEIIQLQKTEKLNIPITIFSNKLGFLEAITKYLKENLHYSYKEIAKTINRNEKTIWTTYNKANKKQTKTIYIKETKIYLPISIFENKKLTILESLVKYLKSKNMKYIEIAELLNRDQRNIWTVYSRAIKKLS
jgi:DNA-directed RNA polymerase specialized sigma24 family protein